MNPKRCAPPGRFLAPLLLGLVLASIPIRAQSVPADAQYVSSSRGRVYYPLTCDAWRSLRSALRFFSTRDEAEEAGDTLDCSDGPRIRLLLIDAPEMNQGDFGAAAKTALERLAPPGSELVLEYDVNPCDRYGRTLAYLWSGEVLINARMIAEGMALVATYPPNVKYVDHLLPLQAQAREERRGLWSVDAFECAPADFRARRCQ